MQQILVDMAVLGLIVFLFVIMSRGRHEARLWYWTTGWLFVVAHFAVELWTPTSTIGLNVQSCISVDALLLAASSFIYSHAMLRLPARTTHAVAVSLIPATLLTVNLAICGWPSAIFLVAFVIGRQVIAMVWIWRARRELSFARSSIVMALLIGTWMCTNVLHGRPEIVVYGLLCEVYLSAALNFYAYGWRSSIAVRTMIAGFAAWGAVFPVAYVVANLWPQWAVNPEVWNVPKFFVAIGMILAVIEEDTRAARALGEDYRLLFDGNPEPLWIVEIKTQQFLAANQAVLDLHGYTREEFLSLKLSDVLPEEDSGDVRMKVDSMELLHRGVRHLRKDGTSIFIDVCAQGIHFQGRRCRFAMAVDVTEREELQQQLDHQAGHDRLTGLPNRMLLPELLAHAVERTADRHEKVAVLAIDIDRFKRVNDVYGLRIGDAYIEHLAGILTSRLRSMDIVARTGGDEFTIVVTGLKSAATAQQEVNDLMRLFEQPFVIHGYKIQTPVTMGVAFGPDESGDSLALWRGAERALVEAKAAGGNRVVWLSAELEREAEEQLKLEAYLRSHMDDGGLHVAYQPIYGTDGTMHGMEALLRLDHTEFGPVSPVKLIPIAESSGLIIPLGEWVIDEVCRQLLIWRSQGLPLVPVAVNVSGLHIMHEDFAKRLMATLERYAIDPRLVHVELTESVAMRNVDAVTEQMAELSRRGIEFSIDDFGTGHSSLARLSQLGASILKIDRAFLEADCSPDAHSIVQAIITMAHTLGHKVVAEGVENAMQLTCLLDLGCEFYQGFLLSKPVAPEQIPALLGKVHPAFGLRPADGDKPYLVEKVMA
jgi:diguanylate cyclase (GGDEF)-like protein/PAS domain S-box-containing protein